MDDAAAELGKSKGRVIHHVPRPDAKLRYGWHSWLTDYIAGIIVKKDGKPIRVVRPFK